MFHLTNVTTACLTAVDITALQLQKYNILCISKKKKKYHTLNWDNNQYF